MRDERRSCARCGEVGTCLVTGSAQSNAPGRVLVYCERCRDQYPANLDVVIPLEIFDLDPLSILGVLYRSGTTQSDPSHVAEVLGVRAGAWPTMRSDELDSTDESQDGARAAAPFAVALYVKSAAVSASAFSTVQRRRMVESMAIDLRKCSDILTPAHVPYLISVSAAAEAQRLGVDLAIQTWASQPLFDPGRKLFHFEHYCPVGQIVKAVVTAQSSTEILDLVLERLRVAWITKTEDHRLRELGFNSKRPDPAAAYEAAGIELLKPLL